jgi:hypothetical protein
LATVIATFDLTESGDVTDIENALKLNSAGGLGTGVYTMTRGAMKFAKDYLTVSATGGDLTYYNGKTKRNLPRDWKFFACNRTYGAVLVTDGLSNACNENDQTSTMKNWINPCGAAPYACDTGAGTYDCDRRNGKNRAFDEYPAGRIDELWNTTVTDPLDSTKTLRMNARTWVIGVSPDVNPCELNFNAYIGRTDASAPKGDTGFNISQDLDRLPNMNFTTDPNTGKITYTTLKDNEESTSHYNNNDPRTTGQNYAFFASNAEGIANAFADILAGVATGDYTTSSPVGTPMTAGGGYNAYLATTDFPEWKGHLYCYDTLSDPAVLEYDAGYLLNSIDSNQRKIYTWNSSNQLVEVTAGNIAALKNIVQTYTPSFDPSTFTTQVVDFIRGNDGNGTPREWRLGPIMNSTPTIIGRPEVYNQGTVDATHTAFASDYAGRKPLLYVGSDDGMLHCFLITDEKDTDVTYVPGRELFAIIPPNLLSKQVQLYNNFVTKGIVTGQDKKPENHIYGVANSVRYGDVYFPSESKWKTVIFLTEGPGGDLVAALDATDPFSNVTNSKDPVKVLWHYTSQTCPELKNSWSIPAISPISKTGFKGVVGTGYDNMNASTQPYLLVFDPVDGSMVKKPISAASSYYLRNQAFANSVIFQTNQNGYYSDNLADIGIQADLHGRLWFYKVSDNTLIKAVDVSPNPIYYSPAVSGYKKGTNTYDIYAFATGTYYEKDPDITGSSAPFVPQIYIISKTPWGSDTSGMSTWSVALKNLTYTYVDKNGHTQTATLGPRTQVTTSPLLVVPVDGKTDPLAIFAVYDPDTTDCAGTSYIVTIKISYASNGNLAPEATAYSAGSGAVSGFAVVGGKVIVARSGVGEGQRATISKVPDVSLTSVGGAPGPQVWRELQ